MPIFPVLTRPGDGFTEPVLRIRMRCKASSTLNSVTPLPSFNVAMLDVRTSLSASTDETPLAHDAGGQGHPGHARITRRVAHDVVEHALQTVAARD
jgi:hypothetical protein